MLSLSLALSLTFCVTLCLSPSVNVSISLFISLFQPPLPPRSPTHSRRRSAYQPPISGSIALSFSVSVFLCHPVSQFLCQCLYFSLSTIATAWVSYPIPLAVSIPASKIRYKQVSFSLSLSPLIYICIYIYSIFATLRSTINKVS